MSDLDEALGLILERTQKDPELAAALRTLLGGLLARLPESVPVAAAPTKPEPPAKAALEDARNKPGPDLRDDPLGATSVTDASTFVEWPELGGVVRNLWLKAGACLWVAEHGYTVDPAALTDRFALLDEAREIGLYLWMFDLNRVNPHKDEALRALAELFDLTAHALNLWRDAGDTPEESAADNLLAEVQAALRAAAWNLAGYADPDQNTLYRALKLSAQASRTYLPQLGLGYKPMRLGELTAKFEALTETRLKREAQAQETRKRRNKASYHIGLVAKSPTDVAQWRKVDETVAELLEQREAVAGLLEPLLGLSVPAELPRLEALLAAPAKEKAQGVATTAASPEQTWGEAVRQVRPLLAGREILVVGGDERKEAARDLEAAFGCRVQWLETAPHTSLSLLEPAVTGDIAVMLLLIRWSSHVYGELAHVCKERGVPLVRLAGGYNPNRVAHDILEQAAARLVAGREAPAPDVRQTGARQTRPKLDERLSARR